MKLRHLFVAVLAIVAMTSCKSQFEALLNGNDTDAKYKAAFDYFNAGKYSKAATLFESLSVMTSAPGGFLIFGVLMAAAVKLELANPSKLGDGNGCAGGCLGCPYACGKDAEGGKA